jgi:hypothetical protein
MKVKGVIERNEVIMVRRASEVIRETWGTMVFRVEKGLVSVEKLLYK